VTRKAGKKKSETAAPIVPGARPRPAAAPAAGAASKPASSPYIISPRADLVLIVGAAIVCPALLLPLAQITSPKTVWLMVMTFGAVGHHFPSFLRTYGDRAIFQRYRARLLLAPPLLFAATLGFSLRGLHGMLLVSMCWSIWHGMMQHFGFMRIYDAKVGAANAATARRLDFWISASWFGMCLVWSPNQGGSLLESLYTNGVPLVPLQYLSAVRVLLVALTAVVTVIYVVSAARSNRPRSWLKLLLLVGTFVYVYLVRVVTYNPYLSVALFELLHDVQYLAIVWAFNRRMVEKGSDVGILTRWFYRPRAASIAGYVAACLAYGAVGLTVYTQLTDGRLKQVLEALLITSGLLHFYYDGFIWKLSQADTKRGLGIATPAAVKPGAPRPGPLRAAFSRPALSGLLHVALLAVPLFVLARLERGAGRDELAKAQALVTAVPNNPTSQNNLGFQLLQADQTVEAIAHLEKAIALQPDLEEARENMSLALVQLSQESQQAGRKDEAVEHAREAVTYNPDYADSHNNLGVQLAQVGRYEEAEQSWRRALELDPSHVLARQNLDLLARMRSSPSNGS
jgi:tetratricopeptide (TPR) repeat protein